MKKHVFNFPNHNSPQFIFTDIVKNAIKYGAKNFKEDEIEGFSGPFINEDNDGYVLIINTKQGTKNENS